MSIIQKLENYYVAILRVVVIVVATGFLISATIYGVMSLKGMLPVSEAQLEVESVDPDDVVSKIAEKPAAQEGEEAAAQEPEKAKAYMADYEKAYTAVSDFISKTSKKTLDINKADFFEVLDRNIVRYDTDEIKANYASGLAAAFSVSLADKRLLARVQKTAGADGGMDNGEYYGESPFNVVNEVLQAYNVMFNTKLTEAKEVRDAAVAEDMQSQISAATRMYAAAALFGAFLLVIFLTIALRMERTLREIASRP